MGKPMGSARYDWEQAAFAVWEQAAFAVALLRP
jgi:hypothetical protein